MCYYVSEYHDYKATANDDNNKIPGEAPSTWFLAFYFVITTMTTLGYGDIIPTNENGRLFTAWYITFGVCLGGTYISMISNHIQEHNGISFIIINIVVITVLFLEKMAKKRDEETVKKLTPLTNSTSRTKSIAQTVQNGFSYLKRSLSTNKHESANKNLDLLIKSETESDVVKEGITLRRIAENDDDAAATAKETEDSKLIDISVKAFDDEIKNMIIYSILDILTIVLAIVIAMFIMKRLEPWSTADAFYFTVATISTVGYGDFHPTNNNSRIFIIFYTLIGTGLLVRSCTNLVKIPLVIRSRRNELEFIRQFGGENLELTTDQLKAVFEAEIFRKYTNIKRNDDELSKAEFVIMLLSMMNRLNEKDLILACKLFDKIDREGRRYLDKADINFEIERLSMAALTSDNSADIDVENNPINIEPSMNLSNNLKASLL